MRRTRTVYHPDGTKSDARSGSSALGRHAASAAAEGADAKAAHRKKGALMALASALWLAFGLNYASRLPAGTQQGTVLDVTSSPVAASMPGASPGAPSPYDEHAAPAQPSPIPAAGREEAVPTRAPAHGEDGASAGAMILLAGCLAAPFVFLVGVIKVITGGKLLLANPVTAPPAGPIRRATQWSPAVVPPAVTDTGRTPVTLDALLARIVETRVDLTDEQLSAFNGAVGAVVASVFGWPPGVTPPGLEDPEGVLASFLQMPRARIVQAQNSLRGRRTSGAGFTLDLVPSSEKYAEELAGQPLSRWDEDRSVALSRLLSEHQTCRDPRRTEEIRQAVRDIGIDAYGNGWIFRMMLIYKRTGQLLRGTPPGLESLWDGIGSWRA